MTSIVRKAPLDAFCLTFVDIKQLYSRLEERAFEALELEAKLVSVSHPQENIEGVKETLRNHFVISVVINGADGQTVVDSSRNVFESNNIPEDVKSVYFTSLSAFETKFKHKPSHHFVVNLDFAKPPLIDFINHSALPTPNNSYIEIFGESENWVSGVFDTVQGKVQAKSNQRGFLHRPLVYDVLLWFLGLPISLYILSRLETIIAAYVHGSFVRIALMVYCVVFTLLMFRLLFSYTKWAFPKVELIKENSKTSMHRRWWFAIITGVLASLITTFRL